ncbi:MAG: hydrolase [Firmicutes bacterium HGW-Firmicutes-14]|jgi:putative nucleotidyltransferase with HDIG domain|nr:MAG: hydrolase [Firmicutes bacterium HGW-Firmicutes-14]
MDQLTLSKILMKAGDLPSLPFVTSRVIQLTDDPKWTPGEISEVICQDQVLASKVLKLVNSAYYGLPRRIATISEAITILGMKTVRTVVIGASIHKALNSIKGKRAINPEKIWRHAGACAESSKMLAKKLGIKQHEQAFMAGLLHDIGKIILNSLLHEEYSHVLDLVETGNCTVIQAEIEILNTTHAEIGKMVAEKWNLPATLVEPIGLHHDPLCRCENNDLVQIVHMADSMAIMAGYNSTGIDNVSPDSAVLEKWGIKHGDFRRMSEEMKGNINIEFI